MDSDIETVLSRVRDKAVARFQILPPVGGEGCRSSLLCGHLSWPHASFQNSLKRGSSGGCHSNHRPPCFHIPEHCNVCTSSEPSLAHVQHAVTGFYSYIVLSYFSSPFPVLSVLLTIPSHSLE